LRAETVATASRGGGVSEEIVRGRGRDNIGVTWLRNLSASDDPDGWQVHARESIPEINDGIAAAAGIAEGFAQSGASARTLALTGVVVMVAGALAAAGARFSEERTESEMNVRLLESERASIEAEPDAELAELTGIYRDKGLPASLARQVAEALTEHDAVAAHAEAELHLTDLDELRSAWPSVRAALIAGLSFAIGAALPLLLVFVLPAGDRVQLTFVAVLVALALTGGIAAWLTELPPLRLIVRNLALGAVTMGAGVLVGALVGL
jgi:vacuolar iron transporter family protein